MEIVQGQFNLVIGVVNRTTKRKLKFTRVLRPNHCTGRNAKNAQTERLRKHVTTLQKRLTRVSGSGYLSFIHVSVAAVTTEPDHFFCTFPSVFL